MFKSFRRRRKIRGKARKTRKLVKDESWKVYKPKALELVNKVILGLDLPKGFEFNKITIRNQKTVWGSCSSKKNLNFNYRIIYLPKEVVKYIVVHELCHLKQMNHSKKFWSLVELFLPNYRNLRKELKEISKSFQVFKVF